MAKAKRVRVGQKLIKPKSTPPAKRRGVILSHNIDYGERDGDQVSLIVTSAQERILGGGLLFQTANKWLPGVANREWQETVALIGIKIAMLTQFILNSAVEPSSDGQYHLDVEIAADNPTHYTIRLRYPQGQGGGITSVTAIDLPAGSQPTASYNAETGALTLGIPRGQSVTSVTAVDLPAGSQPTATYDSATGALQLGIPRGANGQSVTSVTAVDLPAGSQPTATYNSATGALQLGIPRCSCAGEIPPPPDTDAQRCGAARLYAERVLVLSSKLATDLSTGLTAFQAATTTGAAVAFAFGVTVAPPIAIAISCVELFASIGATVISGYNDQATQDEIAKAIYCQLRAQNITSANGMAQVLSAAFANNANKAAWFANTARLLGDDLTTRILGIGAQEPSNACELYNCETYAADEFLLDFRSEPNGVGVAAPFWYAAVWQPGGWRPTAQWPEWGHIFQLDQDLWNQVKQRFNKITRITFYHGGMYSSQAHQYQISLRSLVPEVDLGFAGANKPSPQVVDNLNWTIANSTVPQVWFHAYIVSHIVLKGVLH